MLRQSSPTTMTQGPSPPSYPLTRSIADTDPNAPAPPQNQGMESLSKNLQSGQNGTDEPKHWRPIQYFFYGSLMDERRLTEILRLAYPPVLRPASIVGYSIKMWGPYPTLVNGPPGNVVDGMAYEVQNEDHEGRLAYYETDAYKCATCFIRPASGGDQIVGKTFVWAGHPDDRILRPGKFDLEAWKRARYGSK